MPPPSCVLSEVGDGEGGARVIVVWLKKIPSVSRFKQGRVVVVSNPRPARILSEGGSSEVVQGTSGVVRKRHPLSHILREGEW